MTGAVDPRDHAGAVEAALKATLNDQVFDYGKVPGLDGNAGSVPNIYASLSVERRGGVPVRASMKTGRTGWRVAVRCVGRTVNECRWALYQTAVALDEAVLTVGGVETTPIQFESDQAPAPDDKLFSALATYTYAH